MTRAPDEACISPGSVGHRPFHAYVNRVILEDLGHNVLTSRTPELFSGQFAVRNPDIRPLIWMVDGDHSVDSNRGPGRTHIAGRFE